MRKQIVLSTAYLAPIQYYSKLLQYDQVLIETDENFVKQSYRNRCKIYGANGVLPLTIPVKKINPKTKIKDIIIDYDTNWRKMHWKSIESAYRSSPFFEFYEDGLKPFYENKHKYLLEFNVEIQHVILEHLGMEPNISFTSEYTHNFNSQALDFRNAIHPKKGKGITDHQFKPVEYFQVFQEKYGFMPNLSIVDLLFNEGPNAINILKNV